MGRLARLVGVVGCAVLVGLLLPVAPFGGSPGGGLAAAAGVEGVPAVSGVVGAGVPLFSAVTPGRLVDTRVGRSTVDGVDAGGGAFSGVKSYRVMGRGGVPGDGVGAVVLNVTATNPVAGGYLSVFPAGETRPNASNVNFVGSLTGSTSVVVKVGSGGRVSVFASTRTDVIVDVAGWFVEGSDYTGLNPGRLVDTRVGRSTVDGVDAGGGAFSGVKSYRVMGRGGVPGDGVGAVVLNVTATNPVAGGYLSVFPAGETRPNASNVNFVRGQTVPNLVVAKVGAGGRIDLFGSAATDVVVDVAGWFVEGSDYTGLNPGRLVDTRAGRSTVDGVDAGGGAFSGVKSYRVMGRGGVPGDGVGAVVLNVTATNPVAGGYLSVFPAGETRPNASNVNFVRGRNIANLVVAKVGVGGKVNIFGSAATDVIIDIAGWLPIGVNQVDPATVIAPAGSTVVPGLDPDTATGPVVATYTGPVVQAGDVVATTIGDSSFYGTVVSVTGTRVEFSPATLMDIIPVLDLTLDIDTETGAIQAGSQSGAQTPQVKLDPGFSRSATQELNKTGSCKGSISASVDTDVRVNAGKFKFKVDWGWSQGVRSATVAYTPTFEVVASAGMGAKGSCSFNIDVLDKNLPTIKFSIGPVPVWITQKIGVDIKGDISAEASATVSASVSAGAELGGKYIKGNGFALINDTWVKKKLEPSIAVKADANLFVPVDYEAKAYGLVGFNATASPGLELDVRPLENTWLTLDAVLKGDLRIKIAAHVGPVNFDIGHIFPTQEFIRKRIISLTKNQTNFQQISAGNNHTCALLTSGAVKCWGANYNGQLGDGTETHRSTPVPVAELGSGVQQISAGAGYTCGALTSGAAKCWGLNGFGELGDGTKTNRLTPVDVTGLGSGVKQITAGFYHTCGVLTSGAAKCWGHNYYGQLGDGTKTNRLTPVDVTGLGSGVKQITAGLYHTCALPTSGAAKCWGYNYSGQLGDGTTTSRLTPVDVTG